MASIYFRKDIGKWMGQMPRAGLPRINSKPCETREEVEDFIKRMTAKYEEEMPNRGDFSEVRPPGGNLDNEALAKTVEMFLQSKSCKKRHRTQLKTIVRYIGAEKIGDLTPVWNDRYITRLRGEETRRHAVFADSTIADHIATLNVVVKWRVRTLNLPKRASIVDLTLLGKNYEKERDRLLEDGEGDKIMRVLRRIKGRKGMQWRLLFRLAKSTCARLQELLFAEWSEFSDDLTFQRAFWTIPAQHTKAKVARVMPLTEEGVRVVKLLRAIKSNGSPRVFHLMSKPDSVSAMFHRHVKKAGVVDFRFHDLRHVGISDFVVKQRLFSVDEVMTMVGHATLRMLRRYTRLRGDDLAAKLLPARRAGPLDGVGMARSLVSGRRRSAHACSSGASHAAFSYRIHVPTRPAIASLPFGINPIFAWPTATAATAATPLSH